jgi:predicted ATP-dependent serine protease
MTDEQVDIHWAVRRTKADQIIANATGFKVCDQCWAIMRKHAGKCAVCGAYRFREAVASVRTIAKLTKQSPFPVTAATVPRF